MPAWPKLRRRLIIGLVLLLALAAGYMFWLRDSSLVAVDQVTIRGADQNPSVEEALRAEALEQSTLHVDLAALEQAVAGDPAVRSISAVPDFPHGLTIDVDLREPVGLLKGSGVLVAGDGVILDSDSTSSANVAAIGVDGGDLVGGGSVKGEALDVARVLGAAPAPLLGVVERGSIDQDFGAVIELQGGLELRFGDPGSADLKWRAAAAVLAHSSFTGAAYLDLSVPDRPVAGGVAESSDSTAAEAAAEVPTAPVEPVAPVTPEAVTPVEPAPEEVVPVVPETAAPPVAEEGGTGLE